MDCIDTYFQPAPNDVILVGDRGVEPNEVREWMAILFSLVRDIQVTFLKALDVDNWASVFMRINCTSRVNGAKVEVFQQIMLRQQDGRLAESYPQFDLLRFFEQLGQLPDDAYPLLMAGNKLT
ncbi:hypothetical protein [uncultured Tateyamaria sp.]|uniref:hypothetical protein n=1 Tax=uncultured Tateyamaria sp. TaxID=455651 RepID=UPI0026025AB1|nr:hypothetical protein [uncultured Tateyamaria sp.]